VAAWARTHQTVISRWESGGDLHLIPRHARGLVGALGPEVWGIAGAACLASMEHASDREMLGPVVGALVQSVTALTERGRDLTGRDEKVTWRLRRLPTLEEVASKLGRSAPFDGLELKTLGDLIILTGFLRGWGETIETDAERRQRIRRLQAEIERLSR